MERLYTRCIVTLLICVVCVSFNPAKGTGSKIKVKPSSRRTSATRRIGGGGGTNSDSSSDGFGNFDANLDYSIRYTYRNATHEERLLMYLFNEYEIVARPTMDTSQTVEVRIEFVLLRIHGLDERSQVLTTTGLIISEWRDDRLVWDPEKFGNLTDIIVKADKIWLPELAVMNGAEELIPDFERIRVLLKHDGVLHWEPGGIFRTTCDIDIAFFPFDTQHCPLFIGAYAYYSSKMNITSGSDTISIYDFQPNGEWDVINTSAEWKLAVLECCPETGYPHVKFTLHMKRRYTFYMMNIVLPCVMLSVLIMISFFLPPDAGEKISLGISVLLAFTVFLLMIADNIPRTSLAIPLMVVYLMATMSLGTISICMTVVVLNVHHRASRFPVPPWLKTAMLYYTARLVCIRTHYDEIRKKDRRVFSIKRDNRFKDIDRNGILDEMETRGLTAVLNNRYPNGPSLANHTTPVANHLTESPSISSNLSHNSATSGLKRRHRKLCKSRNSRVFTDDEDEEEDFSRDWHEFAQVLDRVFFWVLLVLMTGSAIVILLYPKYTGLENKQMGDSVR